MAGQIKSMLNSIIKIRSKGNETIALTTKTKLIFKGFDPDRFDSKSPDDPAAIEKIKAIAVDLGVSL
jgi:hypothetical protein